MKVPAEFRKFVQRMHQDIDAHTANEFEMIDVMIGGLTAEERATLKRFLTEFLASGPTVQEARDLWNSTGPDWGILDEGLFWFLRETRDRL